MLLIVLQQSFCREALMWGSLKHKFVLPFYGIYEVSDGRVPQFFLVSPFMIHGTLAQWRKKFSPPVPEIEQRVWLHYFGSSLPLIRFKDTGSGTGH